MNFKEFLINNIESGLEINWHHMIWCELIDKWLNNDIKHLMILAPPRSGMTTIISKLLPIYLDDKLSHDQKVLHISHSTSIANELRKSYYRSCGYNLNNVHNSIIKFNSFGCTLSSKFNYIILDSPIRQLQDVESSTFMKCMLDWYKQEVMTRIDQNGKQLIISPHYHKGLTSYIVSNNDPSWTIAKFPLVMESWDNPNRPYGKILWDKILPSGQTISNIEHIIGVDLLVISIPEKPFEEFSEYDMLRVYARCGNFNDSARFVKVSRDRWKCKWYECGLPSPRSSKIDHSNEELQRYEIAVVSDTHWGSIYQQKTVFDSFILDCKERGINFLVHCGDIVEGLMNQKYHNETRFLNTTSEFEQYFQRNYPTGFKTSIITKGNHDASLSKFDWHYDFCNEMAIRRSDLTYIRKGTSVIGPGNIIINVNHGGGSCAAPGQNRNKRIKTRTLQLMSEEQIGSIFLYGHCHSRCYVPSFMGKTLIGVGCFQAPNETVVASYGGADICGLILSYSVLDNKPINIKLDWRFADQYGGLVQDDY